MPQRNGPHHHHSSKRHQRRPPPPPPPPKSLVQLLRQDQSVLDYFQALQANLEADVQIWKDRAKDWERQVKELRKHGAVTENNNNNKPKSADDEDDSSSSSDEEAAGKKRDTSKQTKTKKAAAATTTAKTTAGKKRKAVSKHSLPKKREAKKKKDDVLSDGKKQQTHDDEDDKKDVSNSKSIKNKNGGQRQSAAASSSAVFDLESADDDDEQDEMDTNPHELLGAGKQRGMEITDDMLSYPSDFSDSENDLKETTKVPVKTTPFEENQSDDGDSAGDSDDDEGLSLSGKPNKKKKNRVDPETQKYLDEVLSCLSELNIEICDEGNRKRSTDEALWKGIRLAFETLCRVASTEAELKEFPPFRNGIPAPDNHPAKECLLLAFRSVLLIETFGENWKETDLGDRRGFVRIMERELHREVRYGWAAADRKARLSHAGAVFVKDVEEDDPAPESTEVSVDSLPKLSRLLERSCLARLLMGLYISRDEISTAVDVARDYLLSSVPCRDKEDELHPRLPPTLSFVVLEAIIRPRLNHMGWDPERKGGASVELWPYLWGDRCSESTNEIYFSSIHHTASIWKERVTSRQDRVRHVAEVEVAAYRRLYEECGLDKTSLSLDRSGFERLRKSLECNLDSRDQMMAYQLCLVSEGLPDLSSMIWLPERSRDWNLNRLYCWCTAIRHIFIRSLESTTMAVGSKVALNTPPDSTLQECREQFTWLWELNPFESSIDKAYVLSTLIKCAAMLADGNSVIQYGKELIDILKNTAVDDCEWQYFRTIWDVVRDVTKLPMVRVINLQRRHDRWKHMVCQAMVQEFLIVLGLGDMKASDDSHDVNWMFGDCAYDGQWPRSKLLESLSSPAQLAKLLQTEWRPLELVAFDRDAPRNEKMISMHSSEIACALSHVACWKACSRTFSLPSPVSSFASPSGLLRHPESLWRSLHLAGYAKGAPLYEKNGSMAPAPVCLVLEDDAHVVEDFCSVLDSLLEDLPRDFQYCALGYSRPKAAPILIPWASRPRVGIPSHLFFATGYLVSPAGVAYFQEHAPVQGPVDAWLGLRMTRNFENLVGERLGVGGHGKGGDLSGSQAAKIMDFRAFCAVPPLCSQPLRNTNNTGRRWKDKDTDIVYSGHP
eukprot:scaffold1562_cov170-Amphora_coffeaeformis.AAC.10